MSEYISIEAEYGEDPDEVRLVTNLRLATEGPESYAGRAEGEQGSPLAQTLFGIEGLEALRVEGSTLIVRRADETEWYTLIADITEALKDYYL